MVYTMRGIFHRVNGPLAREKYDFLNRFSHTCGTPLSYGKASIRGRRLHVFDSEYDFVHDLKSKGFCSFQVTARNK
jgi:hypothetical protein